MLSNRKRGRIEKSVSEIKEYLNDCIKCIEEGIVPYGFNAFRCTDTVLRCRDCHFISEEEYNELTLLICKVDTLLLHQQNRDGN